MLLYTEKFQEAQQKTFSLQNREKASSKIINKLIKYLIVNLRFLKYK